MRRQRGHRAIGTLITRHEGNGSPQLSQSGGVKGRTDCQHDSQTGPRVGRSRSLSQAAQEGARTTESTASRMASARIMRTDRPEGLHYTCPDRSSAGLQACLKRQG